MVKQVIVVRKDLNMRKGKIAAQVAHASMSFLVKKLKDKGELKFSDLTDEEREWASELFTKVVVYVESEAELMKSYNKCIESGLNVHLIVDAGRTEFGGVATRTCFAVGPHKEEKFLGITSELKLL